MSVTLVLVFQDVLGVRAVDVFQGFAFANAKEDVAHIVIPFENLATMDQPSWEIRVVTRTQLKRLFTARAMINANTP